jgi:hypothetical protein
MSPTCARARALAPGLGAWMCAAGARWAGCTPRDRPVRPGRDARSAQAGGLHARWSRGAPAVPGAQAQGGGNVVAHARRGGGGQRHERHAGQRLAQLAQPPAAKQAHRWQGHTMHHSPQYEAATGRNRRV